MPPPSITAKSNPPGPSRPLPPTAAVEFRRAALLHGLGLLDSDPEASFDGLTCAASAVTGCPIALVSLLDVERQWFKSRHGLQATETSIAASFCAHAARQSGLFEIEDTRTDPRFADNPLVKGDPGIRFYAGQPVLLDGVPLGTLCVIDTQPRRLTAQARQALEGLAHAAEGLIASRQAVVALREQQQRLADIALASGDWLWESDANGLLLWVATHGIAARADDPLCTGGMLPDGLLLDTRGEAFSPPMTFHQLLSRHGKVTRATVRHQTPERCEYLSFSALPRLDEAGAALGFRGTLRDVTANVAQEQQRFAADLALRLERDVAQSAARLRSDVVSSVSHELRTPLNAVVGFAQLLLRDPQEVKLYATHIHRAGTHLLALVNDMLELARLEAGRAGKALRPVSTASAMQRCVDLLQPEAHRRGVQLSAQTDVGAEVVMADPQGLTQALLNLAGNALKFSPPGSTVSIRARCAAPGQLDITVTDRGAGIAADLIPLLFLPFSQLPGNRKNGGTGLGLAISRQLVQAMSGEISVQSVVGEGATFTIGLRAAEPGTAAVADSAFALLDEPAPLVDVRPLVVLYIEDDPVNVLLVEHMLAHFGPVEMQHAATAVGGTQAALTRHFDLILLDMNLPDGHGLEILKTLRANSRNADVPIVALSADALPESISAARTAGFDDYLTKPIDMAVLERLVSRLR